MRCSLLFMGDDCEYMNALVTYLVKSTNNTYDITCVETIEECNAIKSLTPYHLVVMEEKLYLMLLNRNPELCESVKQEKIVILTEALVADYANMKCIFKYQKGSALEEQINCYLLCVTDQKLMIHQGKATTVIGCYSPMGGAGSTTISQMLASIYNGLNGLVLHLSLDYFPNYCLGYEAIQNANLSDYLAYMMTKDNWVIGLERMVAVDTLTGIHYLKPQVHMQDMIDFSNDLFAQWLDFVKEYGHYDYIIVDMANYDINLMIQALGRCDKKFVTIRQDSVGEKKWVNFQRDLEQSQMIEILDHAHIISNQLFGTTFKPSYRYDLGLNYDSGLNTETRGKLVINNGSKSYKKMEAYLSGL